MRNTKELTRIVRGALKLVIISEFDNFLQQKSIRNSHIFLFSIITNHIATTIAVAIAEGHIFWVFSHP